MLVVCLVMLATLSPCLARLRDLVIWVRILITSLRERRFRLGSAARAVFRTKGKLLHGVGSKGDDQITEPSAEKEQSWGYFVYRLVPVSFVVLPNT